MDDPRNAGFNYGTGWGSNPKPDVYEMGYAIATELRRRLSDIQKEAWRMDMYLWKVRIASTPIEKTEAIMQLSAYLTHYQKDKQLWTPNASENSSTNETTLTAR